MYSYSKRLKNFGSASPSKRSRLPRKRHSSVKFLPLKSACLDEVLICKEVVNNCKDEKKHEGNTLNKSLRKSNIILSTNKKFCNSSCTGSSESNPASCSICLEEYRVGDNIAWSRHPECNHVYHRECIGKWLESKSSCPICRKPFYRKKKVIQQEKLPHNKPHIEGSWNVYWTCNVFENILFIWFCKNDFWIIA